ncbi:MAG: hypothetical protein AMXMBFR82_41390 [Candidatus Hydrogenedentota bacterium]
MHAYRQGQTRMHGDRHKLSRTDAERIPPEAFPIGSKARAVAEAI